MRRAHNFIDLSGRRFGRLTAVAPATWGKAMSWECVCDCGVRKVVNGGNLKRGRVQSCGCLNQENRLRTDNKFRSHGAHKSPAYTSWQAMLSRCGRRRNKDWHKYGGRGISVCARWRSDFAAFLADMGERPAGHTLDRIDNDGNYEPANCRWATARQQGRNTRSTRFLTVNGQTLPLIDWAKTAGVGASTVRERLRRGWTPEDAVEVAPLPKGLAVLHPSRRAYQAPQPRRREQLGKPEQLPAEAERVMEAA